MFRKLTFLLFIVLALAVAGCSVLAGEPLEPAQETAAPQPDDPVSSEDPVDVPDVEDDWRPQPGDEVLGRADVEKFSAEVLTLESFPPQFMLHITGEKGNPCNILRVQVDEPDEQNSINVEVYTLFDPAATCLQVMESFDLNVPLGSFEAGEYTVFVNGEQVAEIVSP